MLRTILLALGLGLAANTALFQLSGIKEAQEMWSFANNLPKGLEVLVALGILTEAQLNGGHSAREHWSTLWRRLLVLLVVALALRGAAIYVVAWLFDVEEPWQLATGLTATDPAAIGIALSMVKTGNGSRSVLEGVFWLLAVESMLNDAEGLIAFNIAKGTGFADIGVVLLNTSLLALGLAWAVTGARWSVRFWLSVSGRPEPYIEVALVATIYIGFVVLATETGASIIGMVAIAALLADKTLHMIQQEVEYPRHQHTREKMYDLWNNLGLAAVFGTVVAFMPFREILTDRMTIIVSLAVLGAILVARLGFELFGVLYRERRNIPGQEWAEVGVSTLASVSLLGVPSIVGFEMYIHGHNEVALVALGSVVFSWITVFVTVPFIQAMERRYSLRDTDSVAV